MTRNFWLLFHRWVGLGMAGFLVFVGLTGSMLAFYRQIDMLVNPQLHHLGTAQMNAADLGEHAEALAPHARVEGIWFGQSGDVAEVTVYPRIDPTTRQPYDLSYDQLLLH